MKTIIGQTSIPDYHGVIQICWVAKLFSEELHMSDSCTTGNENLYTDFEDFHRFLSPICGNLCLSVYYFQGRFQSDSQFAIPNSPRT